jgi:Protein of unknown function (DUF2695)
MRTFRLDAILRHQRRRRSGKKDEAMKLTAKPVLRPNSSAEWREFCVALWRALGDEAPGLCMGTHYFTERLLEARGFDVEASLALYEGSGGYCDCELLLNVDVAVAAEGTKPTA